MRPPQADPPKSFLAKVYGLSRQGFSQLCKRHGIEASTFESTECVFIILSEKMNRSGLRRRLADPAERERIQNQIYEWYASELTQRFSPDGQASAFLP
ncbi:hypothetical protein JIN84_05175 [Luteolibacter yonseiensis]|uniref:Uncharacterized protein n=2 Tax=Luteolibacter yonseiensis TaxID=1144680 RepID=A0A934R3V3_9BACT|nr:hypothetical protein [Luteolibacter yonseiensis]MBK1814995.1 hypothetical protein [Luteolibacter yonseiensis]